MVGACGCSLLQPALPPGRGMIRLLGRWDASGAPERIVAVNPGSSFEFRYEGTNCVLHFDRSANKAPLPQLWVEFDGEWTKQVVDRDALALGEGAKPGRHQVWAVVKALDEHQPRWKPPLVASLTLTGIEVPDGKLLRPPRQRRLILEAIGDSITEGILVYKEGKDWPDKADSRFTYAFQTSEALGAEPRIIGFGAQGVAKGGNGGVPPVGLAYPFVYEGIPAEERPADIVVINQGCNDWNAPSIENGYRNLLRIVRKRNPDAYVFCLIPFAQAQVKSIQGAVAAALAEGDRRVFLVETKGWLDPKADTTDGVHPSAEGHAKAAEQLTAFIKRTLRR
jgi:lysophospholipase L1-like esterase